MFINGITFIDNTYARDIATCSTRAFILRILGYTANDSNKDAAHVGSAFHAGVEAYFKGASKAEAIEAFTAKYDELIKSEEPDEWGSLSVE